MYIKGVHDVEQMSKIIHRKSCRANGGVKVLDDLLLHKINERAGEK